LLSGVGVEEIFLGYERYQAVKALSVVRRASPGVRLLCRAASRKPRLRERIAKFERMLLADPVDWPWVNQSYYAPSTWSELVPNVELDAVVATHREHAARARATGASLLDTTAQVDRRLFLPGLNLMYADRASMRASVELRVPFLGDPVTQAAAAAPSHRHVGLGNGKRLFRAAAKEAGVPDFVLHRSKTGFGAPVRSTLREHGSEVWRGIRHGSFFDDMVDRSATESLFNAHVAGLGDHGLQLFGLCALSVWWEKNVAGDGSVAEHLATSAGLTGSELP
jgi:asparagine synthase (glutamine-hydrolysing)